MATQARAVLKIPARIVGAGDISVALQNGIYVISSLAQDESLRINSQTGNSYTIVADDEGKLLTFENENTVIVAVPAGLDVGFNCEVAQLGTGPVNFVGAGGTAVNALRGDTTLAGQYSMGWLRSYAPNIFILAKEGGTVGPVMWNQNASFGATASMATTGSKFGPISASATTSAGVYDSSNKLVRTLWNAEVGHPDRSNPEAAWDGTIDNGTVAPSGTYTLKVLAHECTYTWEGVIGNTSPAHTDLRYWNDACPICDMQIAADGKMWYATQYHERLPVIGYSTTSDIQKMDYAIAPTFRQSYSSCIYTTTDGTITYYSVAWNEYTFVVGIDTATNTFVSFPSGGGEFGTTGGDIAIDGVQPGNWITSIAVQQTGGSYLYIARPISNKLLTLNKTTGATLQTNTSFTEPTLVEVNPFNNELWLAHKVAGAWRLTKCSVDGSGNVTASATATSVTIDAPISMSISPDGNTLLLVDAGSFQQVRAFNTSDASVKTAFGTSGAFGQAGGYATTPVVSNTRWMFENLCTFGGTAGWIAHAPDGSWWLGDSGNNRYLHFSSGNAPTFIEHIMYLPAYYACAVCKNDPTRVFAGYQEFTIDYSIALGIGNGSWTLAKNWGYGRGASNGLFGEHYNRLKWVGTYSNGKTYACLDIASGYMGRQWFELTSTGLRDTGVPVNKGSYFDDGMNAWYTLWGGWGTWSRMSTNPSTGFDGSSNPTWTYPVDWSGGFDVVLITETIPITHAGVGVWDDNVPYNHVEVTENNIIPVVDPNGMRAVGTPGFYHMMGLNATTGAIMWASQPTHANNHGGSNQRFLLYPEVPFFPIGSGLADNAGGVFVYEPGQPHIFFCNVGEGWGNNQVNIWHHYHDSGLMLKRFGVAAPYYAAMSLSHPDAMADNVPSAYTSFKALDQMAGNAKWGGHAYVDGKYYLYQNDEWYHGGLHRWKVDGLSTVSLSTRTKVWNSADYVAPTTDTNNLLAGLPFDVSSVPNGTAGWTRSPATNTLTDFAGGPWFKVYTNAIRCDPREDCDITLEATWNNAGGPAFASRTIPRVGAGNWTLDARVYLYTGTHTIADPGEAYWVAYEIVDNTGKVLLQVYNFSSVPENWSGCKCNGTDLFTPITTDYKWPSRFQAEVPLIVTANVGAGTMQVTYETYTVTRSPLEVGASLANPAAVRLKYKGPDSGIMGICQGNISYLRWSEV